MKLIKLIYISVFVFFLSSCASSGNNFDAKGLASFKVGVTTVQEATVLLKAKPVQIIENTTGKWVAWRYITSNGITMRTEIKEALVVFDTKGKFVRIHQLQNVDATGMD